MFDTCLEDELRGEITPARALVLLLIAVKAPPLLVTFTRILYALHGYDRAASFVLAWRNGRDDRRLS